MSILWQAGGRPWTPVPIPWGHVSQGHWSWDPWPHKAVPKMIDGHTHFWGCWWCNRWVEVSWPLGVWLLCGSTVFPCPFPCPFPFLCHNSQHLCHLWQAVDLGHSPGCIVLHAAKQVELALVTGSSCCEAHVRHVIHALPSRTLQIDESLSRLIHFQAGYILKFKDMDLDVDWKYQLQYHLSNWKRK